MNQFHFDYSLHNPTFGNVQSIRKDINYCITKTGTKHKNPQTSGAMRNNESTTTEPSPWNVQQ